MANTKLCQNYIERIFGFFGTTKVEQSTYSVSIPFLSEPVSEVAAVVLSALTGHFIVFTKLSFVSVGQILQLLLGGDTG